MAHKEVTREALDETLNEYLDGNLVSYDVFKLSDTIVSVDGVKFEIIDDPEDTFDVVLFKQRYTDFFDKFDYIVGDMAYNKLRLRGFYEDGVKNVPVDMHISSVEDYLVEYCNFGVKYFVLKRLDEKTVTPDYRKKKKKGRKKNKNFQQKRKSHKSEKSEKNNSNKGNNRRKSRKKYKSEKRFEIRKKDE